MNLDPHIRRWLFDPMVGRLAAMILGLAVIYAISQFLRRSIGKHITDADKRYRARKIVSFAGYALTLAFLAAIFSDRLRTLTVAFGVAGAGIAFALQEVIASVAGWIAISFGDFYRPGDRVQLGGIKGDVIDIGVLRTTLMEIGQWVDGDLYNGRMVRVANSFVFKEPVVNYSGDFPFLWDEIKFPMRYGADWRFTREMLQRVADEVVGDFSRQSKEAWKQVVRSYRIEEARIDPAVTLKADQNWVEFTLRYIVDYRLRRLTRDRLFTRILEEVDASQGRVRIATTSFEMTVNAAPRLDVSLESKS